MMKDYDKNDSPYSMSCRLFYFPTFFTSHTSVHWISVYEPTAPPQVPSKHILDSFKSLFLLPILESVYLHISTLRNTTDILAQNSNKQCWDTIIILSN